MPTHLRADSEDEAAASLGLPYHISDVEAPAPASVLYRIVPRAHLLADCAEFTRR